MKKAYGTVFAMIFSGIVFAAIMALVSKDALLGKVGDRMETKGEDFSYMADTLAVEAACAREEPKIQYAGKNVWGIGEAVLISETFLAADAEGIPLSVQVSDIIDQDGRSAWNCYHEEAHKAVFEQRGIYTFTLETVDRERKSATRRISILVDER